MGSLAVEDPEDKVRHFVIVEVDGELRAVVDKGTPNITIFPNRKAARGEVLSQYTNHLREAQAFKWKS